MSVPAWFFGDTKPFDNPDLPKAMKAVRVAISM